ncbi:ComEC/Rec2 family competence protein [Olsenella porci]|uniref:ComEC/Rec2 family competence protein n=1 Tax=Olsenella porci TaxID=2652279 RepID=UPI002DDC6385|nr:ComEC/Rec2 family competence protein [Olsenella porci]
MSSRGGASGERFPDRPHLPVTIPPLVCAILAERAVLTGRLPSGPGTRTFLVPLLVLSAGVLLLRRGRGLGRALVWPCVLVAVASLGGLAACGSLAEGRRGLEALSSVPVSSLELRTVEDSHPTRRGFLTRAEASLDDRRIADVYLSTREELSLGHTVSCVGRLRELGDDDFAISCRARGIVASVSVSHVRGSSRPGGALGPVLRLREALVGALDPGSSPERALVAGVCCGYRTALMGDPSYELIKLCGVAHLVAVSGSHLSIVTGIIAGALGRTALRPPSRIALLASLSGIFVLLCGSPVSAVRAWLMSLVAMGSQLAGRRAHSASSAGVVALCMAMADPHLSCDLGFLLSVSSVLGLCALSRYLSWALGTALRLPHLERLLVRRAAGRRALHCGGALVDALAASLAAQAATLPISTVAFGRLPLLGPFASVLLSPIAYAMIPVGLAHALLSNVGLGMRALGLALDALAGAFGRVLTLLAGLPWTSRTLMGGPWGFLAAMVPLALVLAFWPHPSRRTLRAFMALSLGVPVVLTLCAGVLQGPRVCVLDVGQGDAVLVQDGRSAVLVDAGPADDSCARELARLNVRRLDAVVVTHLHDDHYGGVRSLVGCIPVGSVLVGQGASGNVPPSLGMPQDF